MAPNPLRVMKIDHVVLRCARLDETLTFYRDVLGCPVERVVESIGLHQIRAGESLIDLVPIGGELAGDGAPRPEAANMHHVCLRVASPSWDRIREHLLEAGVEFAPLLRRYGADGFGQSVYIRDPEGNQVELKGPPE